MKIQHFYDKETNTLTYVVYDAQTKDAIVIDPVMDFDPASGEISDRSAKLLENFISNLGLKLHYILETHAHADHLSASQILKRYFPNAKIGISERIKSVQSTFRQVFNISEQAASAQDFDLLIKDNLLIQAGSINILPIPTPGHTPACTSFFIDGNLFTGDALFMPDAGTGRCDFPNGSSSQLYASIKSLYRLPDETRVYVGHDYQPNGRELKFETTIGDSKRSNIQLTDQTTAEDYVKFRDARDKTLKAPRLLLPSLQVNIAAGKLPKQEGNGKSYLKIPLKISFDS